MEQTIIVWLIIGVSAAYLARHFYQAWQGIAQGKGGCGSCGNCPSSKAKPTPVMPSTQVVGIDSLLTAKRQPPSRGSNDASPPKM